MTANTLGICRTLDRTSSARWFSAVLCLWYASLIVPRLKVSDSNRHPTALTSLNFYKIDAMKTFDTPSDSEGFLVETRRRMFHAELFNTICGFMIVKWNKEWWFTWRNVEMILVRIIEFYRTSEEYLRIKNIINRCI